MLRAGGDGSPLQAVAAPLTPRPRGTIFETLTFIVECSPDEIPSQGWDQGEDMTMPSQAAEDHPM